MPRPHRHFASGIPVHVIQRGNNRQRCYFKARDYSIYLEKLREYSVKYAVAIHSYVLMTNHVHLLVTPSSPEGISNCLQALGRYYVRYINSTYGRTGTLWEGRFKACMIDSDAYFLTASRYIELNPVRAMMVSHPAEHPWSSYRMNALGHKAALLTPHPLYCALGKTDAQRQKSYRALFRNHLSNAVLEQIRSATNKAWVLGDKRFRQQLEQQLGCLFPPGQRGGDRKSGIIRKPKIKLL